MASNRTRGLPSTVSSPMTPGSSKGSTASQSKVNGHLICPHCSDEIIDPVGKKKGHPSIQCNGPCQMWLHRQCAGLSKAAFEAAGASSAPFFCHQCIIASQNQEITNLKTKLEEVTRDIAHLKSEVDSLKSNMANPLSINDSVSDPTNVTSIPSHSPASPHSNTLSNKSHDKKLNLVFHGIRECPTGTSFNARMDNDYNAVLSAIGSDDQSLIRDCIRLGKFQSSNSKPRPILVKFNNMKTVQSILFRPNSASDHGISIKKDLSLHERKINSILLKERHRLITEENTAKNQIKIRRNKIFIRGRSHGEVRDNDFVPFPSLSDVAPSLSDLSPVQSSNSTQGIPSIQSSNPSPLSSHQSGGTSDAS
uniref:PHD-type domain-containing protein n=1 Tax=Amphimedon queenslandica TaxID=400682 RepID=A0A1X7TK40_AMPQE